MSVLIAQVTKESPAARAGILPGERLHKINTHDINDVLDYEFYAASVVLNVSVENINGEFRLLEVIKEEDEPFGIYSETFLMDGQKSCKNNCIFCFIDQLPDGMRQSLYFKDDDARLSFLFGNYITLTNLEQRDISRIIEMKISPVNISVHTANPELRNKMMNNRFAGEKLEYIKQLAQAGIKMNCQLVLVPGVNDGAELEKTLDFLAAFYPQIQSVAAVPVGLTGHRDGLYPVKPFDCKSAGEVLKTVKAFNKKYGKESFVWPADEFFMLAGEKIPAAVNYGEFHQLENGVGMWALFEQELSMAMDECEIKPKEVSPRSISIATGLLAEKRLQKLLEKVTKKWHNVNIRVYGVENKTFGRSITVSGLLCGGDLAEALKGQELGDRLLLPSNMLRREGDAFLDDMTPEQLSDKLSIPVEIVDVDGYALLECILRS